MDTKVEVGKRTFMAKVTNLIWFSETTATRFTLAFSGCLFALFFWTDEGTCKFIACQSLYESAEPIGGWRTWAVSWTFYGCAAMWRLFDDRSRPICAYGVNDLGAFLYASVAMAVTIGRWPYVTLSVAEIGLALAAAWVLLRTRLHSGSGLRGD